MFLTFALSGNVRLCILRWSTSRYNSNVIFHIETQKNFTMVLLRDANGFEHNHRAQLFVYFHLQFTRLALNCTSILWDFTKVSSHV